MLYLNVRSQVPRGLFARREPRLLQHISLSLSLSLYIYTYIYVHYDVSNELPI